MPGMTRQISRIELRTLLGAYAFAAQAELSKSNLATPLGKLLFFVEKLWASGSLDAVIGAYTREDVRAIRNEGSTWALTLLAGHKRYAHILVSSGDDVLAKLASTPPDEEKRQGAVEDLDRAYSVVMTFNGRAWREPNEDDMADTSFSDAVADYDKAVFAAIRAGIYDDWRVRVWLSSRRGLRQWALLRRARLGLETGLPREMTLQDVWLANEASKASDMGLGPEEMRREIAKTLDLIAEGLVTDPLLDPHTARSLRQGLRRVRLTRQGWQQRIAALTA
jgi:hypothetical protein